jgi:glycosyltransferase involved in cell wall biosynthesis
MQDWRFVDTISATISSAPVDAPLVRVTVVICTRDRGDSITATLTSIWRCSDLPDEIVIVDQSEGSETREALAELEPSPVPLRYIADDTVGLSAARNTGIRAATGDVLIFVDDDCVVDASWIDANRRVFEDHPEVQMVAGSVVPPDGFDWSNGYVPNLAMTDGNSQRHPYVMGANLAIRVRTAEQVGPFDEALGAGSPGKSGEDLDYLMRVYKLFGHSSVYGISRPLVVHEGGGRFGDARYRIVESYGFGEGALLGKLVRTRDSQAVSFARLIFSGYWRNFVAWAVHRSNPPGFRRVRHAARGLFYGLKAARPVTTGTTRE